MANPETTELFWFFALLRPAVHADLEEANKQMAEWSMQILGIKPQRDMEDQTHDN